MSSVAEITALPASDELALVRAAASGDNNARGALYNEHAPSLLRYLNFLHSDGAEDILHDVFVEAFKGMHLFRGESSFRHWLFVIAKRQLSKRKRQLVSADESSLLEIGIAAGWGVVRDDERLVARISVGEALHQVTAEDREIILLSEGSGFTGEELAKILELSLPAVKSRLHRARLRLMAVLRA